MTVVMPVPVSAEPVETCGHCGCLQDEGARIYLGTDVLVTKW